jgi:hypothetical protein
MFESTLKKEEKAGPKSMEPKALTIEEIESIARVALDDAVDFRDSEIQDERELADKYYQGQTRLETVEGRSKVVVTKVRDAVKQVIPSLARIFTQIDEIAEFYSDDEEDQKLCSDATRYCNNVYHKHDGYKAIIEASIDALKAKAGIIKVTVQNKQVVSHKIYKKSDVQENVVLLGETTEETDEEIIQTYNRNIKVWELKALAPENFLISPDATHPDEARLCAHQEEKRISDLVEMGLPYDELINIPSSTSSSTNTEDAERKDFDYEKEDGANTAVDPSSRVILYTEAYLRVDADGDGIAELRKLQLVGESYKILSSEPVNHHPFAAFKAELQPHVFYPICLAEDLIQDQDAQTALLRSIIDNAAFVNSPRTVVNESKVNLDDVKSGKIGAIIRAREMGQIEELVTPFVAGQTLSVLQHLNEVSEARSGIVKLSQGLDADALQSTTKIAAAAAISAADARIEMMARNIGETGIKSLFNCILRTAIFEAGHKQSIKTPDGFKTVDPSEWHTFISVRINFGLGSGRVDEKQMALSGILPIQQAIIERLGTGNPICNWNNVRETLKTKLRLAGIHDCNKYFPYVAPEQLAELDKKQQEMAMAANKEKQAAQQMQQSAIMEMIRVENKKVETNYQSKIQQMQQTHAAEIERLKSELMQMMNDTRVRLTEIYLRDDRERDKADMTFAIDTKKVGLEEKAIAATEAKVAADREAPPINE